MAPALAPTVCPCHARLGEAPLGLGPAVALWHLLPPALMGKTWRRKGHHPITSEREEQPAGRTWLLPGGEEKAVPWPCMVAFYFHGRLEAHRGPWDTDINNPIPGTPAARDLSELIFPLFSLLISAKAPAGCKPCWEA